MEMLRKMSIQQALVLGSLPACIVAMIMFRDPGGDHFMSDMPGGANRFTNRSRKVSIPVPIANRGNRQVGRRSGDKNKWHLNIGMDHPG